jgi:ribonucleotide reductase beta subunit family protein with ferritin-like domain
MSNKLDLIDLTEDDKALHIAFVRQRIKPSKLIQTTPELFEKEADEFAKLIVEHYPMKYVKKWRYYAEHSLFPFCEYVA